MNTKKKICFENIICLYGMMNEIASKKMTAYKSDLEIDHFRRTANVILTIKRTIKHLCIVSLI